MITKISSSRVSPHSPASPSGAFGGSRPLTASRTASVPAASAPTSHFVEPSQFARFDVLVAYGPFTPVASPSHSSLAVSVSLSEVKTVMESVSMSNSQHERLSVLLVESEVMVESESFVESNVVEASETAVDVTVNGRDSEIGIIRVLTIFEVITMSMVSVACKTMVSSVLVSLTFVRGEIPAYVTIVAQSVLAVEEAVEELSLYSSRVPQAGSGECAPAALASA